MFLTLKISVLTVYFLLISPFALMQDGEVAEKKIEKADAIVVESEAKSETKSEPNKLSESDKMILYTNFFQAMEKNDIHRLQELIDEGADVNSTEFGKSPIHWAAEMSNLDVVMFLYDKGAELKQDSLGNTPLHYACLSGNKEIAEFLIDREGIEKGKPNVNIRNWSKITPLHYAVESGNMDLVEILIQKGAEINAINVNGFTPYDFADTPKMRYLLDSNGGKPASELEK